MDVVININVMVVRVFLEVLDMDNFKFFFCLEVCVSVNEKLMAIVNSEVLKLAKFC